MTVTTPGGTSPTNSSDTYTYTTGTQAQRAQLVSRRALGLSFHSV